MGGCVTTLVAWASGPSALASRGPWGRRCRETHGPTRRASVRGYAGVYTDWRKRPLGAVLGHSCTLLRRCNTARPQGTAPELRRRVARGPAEGRLLVRRLTKRRSLRPPRRAECAFPSHYRPGDAGPNPPRQPAGHYGKWLNWANALEQPPARLRGGAPGTRRPRPGA